METEALSKTALFRGAAPEEIHELLCCLGAERQTFSKGGWIFRTGDTVTALGMVLSGRVLIENTDLWGSTTVLDSVGPGQISAETYACTAGEPLMVDAVAAEPTQVAVFERGPGVDDLCQRLHLSRKIFHTAPKTIRGRLLSYLSD